MKSTRRIALLATSSLSFFGIPAGAAANTATPFTIQWTAPGDDSLTGRATVYDLRFSKSPITPSNFGQATRIGGLPTPANAGTAQTFVVSGLPDGVQFYLALKTSDERGNWSGISNVLKRTGVTTGVAQPANPLAFSSPWPNPARTSARWSFSMPKAAEFEVEVLDLVGRRVRTVTAGTRSAGRGELVWDLRDEQGNRVGPGMYFVNARVGATNWTQRLIVVR